MDGHSRGVGTREGVVKRKGMATTKGVVKGGVMTGGVGGPERQGVEKFGQKRIFGRRNKFIK